MPRRSNRIVFLTLTLTALSLYWGCSQPEDVVSNVTTTRLTLIPERLPTLPDNMDYELWVTDDIDTTSLGKFKYDQEMRTFTKADGTTDNIFDFSGDLLKHHLDQNENKIYDYTTIFVTVEAQDDNDNLPGPIMLRDAVTNPEDEQIELLFQNAEAVDTNIIDATVRFNYESVSDRQRTVNDGSGIWFTTYQFGMLHLPDTLRHDVILDSVYLGTLEIETIYNNAGNIVLIDTVNRDEIIVKSPFAIDSTKVETTEVTFGEDTIYLGPTPLLHIGYRVFLDSQTDTIAPFYKGKVDYIFVPSDTVPKDIPLDMFSQDDFGLPDYGADWKYKGWIVSTTARTLGGTPLVDLISDRLTPPAWRYDLIGANTLPGAEGALITTGSFSLIDKPDDDNPYVLDTTVIPQYPGEDFLNPAAMQARYNFSDGIDLLPNGVNNKGTVFITLEPTNFTSDTTNFPLFAFMLAMPNSKAAIPSFNGVVQETMNNRTQTNRADLQGFPKITIEVETF